MLLATISVIFITLLTSTVFSYVPLSTRVSDLEQSNNTLDATDSLGAEVSCFYKEILKTATTRECIWAALKIPESADQATFHGNDPVDTWYLPWSYAYKSCRISVAIGDGLKETASWDRIKQTVSDMITVCSTGQYPLGRTGGSLTMGSGGLIKVRVEKNTGVNGAEPDSDIVAIA